MARSADIKIRHHVHIYGDGPVTILLAHGFGCDQNMWRHVAPILAEENTVITFDHAGAGHSDPACYDHNRHASLDGYRDDVIELIEGLGHGPVVFVGHSVSAMIGALAAIRRPELFVSLVMIGPSPRYLDDGNYRGGFSQEAMDGLLDLLDANYLGWSSQLAPLIVGNPDRPQLAAELENSFCRTNPDIARRFARVTFLSDNRADLGKVRTPTLILQCRNDVIAGENVGLYTHAAIAGSQYVLLEATGHCPNLSHPDEIAAIVGRHLTDLSSQVS